MRFTLLKAYTEKTVKNDKTSTPIVGYLFLDTVENEEIKCNRKEGYDLVKQYGGTNVEAKIRVESSNEGSIIYYLKPTEGRKINDFLEPNEAGENPYLVEYEILTIHKYNPNYGDDRECECGHPYYRHFDSYDEMVACGCKYCNCYEFKGK